MKYEDERGGALTDPRLIALAASSTTQIANTKTGADSRRVHYFSPDTNGVHFLAVGSTGNTGTFALCAARIPLSSGYRCPY